jgi:hypothetical protein
LKALLLERAMSFVEINALMGRAQTESRSVVRGVTKVDLMEAARPEFGDSEDPLLARSLWFGRR